MKPDGAPRDLLEEFLHCTESIGAAIESEDTPELERLIAFRAELIGKIDTAGGPGHFPELTQKIRDLDGANSRALAALMDGYKDNVRKMKLGRKSVRLYSGTDLPPDAGFFDKKS